MNRSEQLKAIRADVDALAQADEATVLDHAGRLRGTSCGVTFRNAAVFKSLQCALSLAPLLQEPACPLRRLFQRVDAAANSVLDACFRLDAAVAAVR